MNAKAERTEIVTATEVQPPSNVVQADAASLMAVIARAASDPTVDVDKLERLAGLYERITERNAKAAYSAALAEMQPKLPVIGERGGIKNNSGVVQSTYALWEDVNDAIRPIMQAHGFALSFKVSTAADGKIAVTGILSHREGHSEETTLALVHDSSGSKNAVQAVGSSVSYGKRYTAMALLNITTRGEDDDGQSAGQSGAAERAITDINACEDLAALRQWKGTHYDGLSKVLNAAELRQVVELYNRRVKTKKAAEEGGAK